MPQADVLREIRSVLRPLPGIRSTPDQPGDVELADTICLVYPGPGQARLGTSSGRGGTPNRWQLDTVLIDVYRFLSDLARDMETLEPLAEAVPAALMAAFARDRFNGWVVTLGDPQTPGAVWPVRRSLIMPDKQGIQAVGYHFEVDVAYQVEILYD